MENIAIYASDSGLTVNPAAAYAIADRLTLTLALGRGQPFRPRLGDLGVSAAGVALTKLG